MPWRIFHADLRAMKVLRRISCKHPQDHIRVFCASPSETFRRGVFVRSADVLSEREVFAFHLCDSEALTPHRDQVKCNCRSRTFEYQPLHHVFSSQFDRSSMRPVSDKICRINLDIQKRRRVPFPLFANTSPDDVRNRATVLLLPKRLNASALASRINSR